MFYNVYMTVDCGLIIFVSLVSRLALAVFSFLLDVGT